jgi:hypothetical protein
MDSEEEEEEVAPEMESEESEEEDLGEAVVYEIELSDDDDDINEETAIGKTANGKPRTATSDVTSKGGNLPSGEIEGQKAPLDSDSGDNLDGCFTQDRNGSGDAHAPHVMEGEDEIEESEELSEETEELEEKIQVGKGRNVTNNKTDIEGAGGKANNVKAPNVTANESVMSKKLANAIKKYNSLLSEAKNYKKENDMFRSSLKDFRKSITETAVFNTNLTHATKLFLEHSTTSEEKKNILSRFDDEVGTIEESKKLYKAISSELGNKKPMTESIENKFVSDKTSSQSTQLNETTTYIDPAQSRVLDLIRRTL